MKDQPRTEPAREWVAESSMRLWLVRALFLATLVVMLLPLAILGQFPPLYLILVLFPWATLLLIRRGRTRIRVDDQRLTVSSPFRTASIEWDDVAGYKQIGSYLEFKSRKKGTLGAVMVNRGVLSRLDQEQLLATVEERLAPLNEITCLRCGTLLSYADRRCPKCGWTWETDPSVTSSDWLP